MLERVKELPPSSRLADRRGAEGAGVFRAALTTQRHVPPVCECAPRAGYTETRNLLYVNIYINVHVIQEYTLKSMQTDASLISYANILFM